MANGYMPRRDGEALGWMEGFARGIAAEPGRYGVAPAEAAALVRVVEDFRGVLAAALDPGTRTVMAVWEKNRARREAESVCSLHYMLIKMNRGILDADKLAIGVRPVNRARVRVACPAASPWLSVPEIRLGGHLVHARESEAQPGGGRGGKPYGATELELHVVLAEEPVKDPGAARYWGKMTRPWRWVEYGREDAGKVATYFGRWASRRGEVGPWSLPVSVRVAG